MSYPVSMKQALQKFAQQSPLLKKLLGENRLKDQWGAVVGEALANKSEPDRVQGQTLWIGTEHPAWGQELQFHQRMILEKLGKLDGRWAKVKEIRFFQRARLMSDTESAASHPNTDVQTCSECGYAATSPLCALCRCKIQDEERATVYQLLQKRPWWRWEEIIQQFKPRLLTQDQFEALRRQHLAHLKDELRQCVFDFQAQPPDDYKRAKAQKTAYFYATMKLACPPDQLSTQAVRGALGRWRYEAIFKIKQGG